jgi:DNA-binding response OmpR family regulator
MDMMMPVMGGWGAARTLRASRETKDIPILATTAVFVSEDLKACFDVGCNGYCVKPLHGVDLQAQIREMLDAKELPAQRDQHAPQDTHVINVRKFWSDHAEDTLLISVVVIATLGLYLAAAHFIMTIL